MWHEKDRDPLFNLTPWYFPFRQESETPPLVAFIIMMLLAAVMGAAIFLVAHSRPTEQPRAAGTLSSLASDELPPKGTSARPHVSTMVSQPAPVRRAARATRNRSQSPHQVAGSSAFGAWRTSRAARAVAQCESGNDNSAHSSTGKYRGEWQMDHDFWSTYGGLRFASSPELASEYEQDLVAYKGYQARGWQPWTCARIVGLI